MKFVRLTHTFHTMRTRQLVLAFLCMTLGACNTYVLPPPQPGMFKQDIAVSDDVPRPTAMTTREAFPARTDLPTKKPDQPANVKRRYMPALPMSVASIEARIELFFVIEADGTVKDVKVLRSSGRTELDDLYVDAVRNWKYTPAKFNGRDVPQAVHQAFQVNLK